jgi:hypothetical protein
MLANYENLVSAHIPPNHGLENFGDLSKALNDVVGTWGIEPQTSTVSKAI